MILKVDVTIEQSELYNYQNSLGYFSTDLMDQWLQYFHALHPLTILLKCFLHVRKLNNTYKGGIGSYCLLIMMIAYLKDNNFGFHKDLQYVLMNLLNFYGNSFNPETSGISLQNENSPFFPTIRNQEYSKLQVIDPLSVYQ